MAKILHFFFKIFEFGLFYYDHLHSCSMSSCSVILIHVKYQMIFYGELSIVQMCSIGESHPYSVSVQTCQIVIWLFRSILWILFPYSFCSRSICPIALYNILYFRYLFSSHVLFSVYFPHSHIAVMHFGHNKLLFYSLATIFVLHKMKPTNIMKWIKFRVWINNIVNYFIYFGNK